MKTLANDLVNPSWIDNGSDDKGYTNQGLTKREYFAALAMQGMIKYNLLPENYADIVKFAVETADDLIDRLNETKHYYPRSQNICVVCGKVPVDVDNGFDTCPDCAKRI